MIALVLASLALLAARLYAAGVVGFGDSEALYASWAVHPQPAYLDHPGLVGAVARALGDGTVPTPQATHTATAVAATLVPWVVFACARALGGEPRRAAYAAFAVALVPEIAVGLFALTPDLLLAPLWLGATTFACIGLRAEAGSNRSAGALLAAGLLAGIASAAKISGVLLMASLAVAYVWVARAAEPTPSAAPPEAPRRKGKKAKTAPTAPRAPGHAARTVWPWAGLAAGLVVLAPVVLFEARTGWPMLRHRLVDTQAGAGPSLRNLGALLGGQLLYLSPVIAWLAVRAGRDLHRHRDDDATSRVLYVTTVVPFVPLVVLTLWSRVAEPHWIAPALLALPLHAARSSTAAQAIAPRRAFVAAVAVAGIATAGAHAWVLVPAAVRLLPADADPKLDITSELYGWPRAIAAVRARLEAMASPFDASGTSVRPEVVVVGPHWTVCAQLQAGLPTAAVGCATPMRDDFDGWLPREVWQRADRVVFVTDNRFPGDGATLLHGHVQTSAERVTVLRGGRVIRVFQIYVYERRAQARGPRRGRNSTTVAPSWGESLVAVTSVAR